MAFNMPWQVVDRQRQHTMLSPHHKAPVATQTRFLNVGHLAKRVKPNGGGVLAPKCSPWLCFLDAANHKRVLDVNIFGNEDTEPDTAEANITATMVAWLVEYMFYRGVMVLVEQPVDSLQPNFPTMKLAYESIGATRYSHRLRKVQKIKIKALAWAMYSVDQCANILAGPERPTAFHYRGFHFEMFVISEFSTMGFSNGLRIRRMVQKVTDNSFFACSLSSFVCFCIC